MPSRPRSTTWPPCAWPGGRRQAGLEAQIQESLERLERQNLVSRNGDLWFFLTNEERDVSQEIKSVDISSAEVSRLVSELVFRRGLGGQTKVRHRDTKTDYDFNRLLDGAPWRQANQQLTLEVLSPVGGDYELMTEAKCIGRSAEGAGRAIMRMANDARVDVELRTYVQIEKYISGPKTDAGHAIASSASCWTARTRTASARHASWPSCPTC
jgi:hypothetical protein